MELMKDMTTVMQYVVLVMHAITNVAGDKQYFIKSAPNHTRRLFGVFGFTADLSFPFVIDIKGINDASILFHDANNNLLFSVMFGGLYNSKSTALNKVDSRSVVSKGSVLDSKNFKKFMMVIVNKELNVYKFDSRTLHLMMKLKNVTTTDRYYVGLHSRHHNAEWIIYQQEKIQRKSWRSDACLVNKMLVDSPIWVKTAENLGICSLHCNADSKCKSFNFNAAKRICQGYVKNCDLKNTENFTFAKDHMHYCRQDN